MFDVTNPEEPALVCRPPEKCFNWAEGSVDHSVNTVFVKMVKLDGSLISTYTHNWDMRLKSKGSLSSDQAIAATKWLNKPENADYMKTLNTLTMAGYTVNMEFCSPTNRIVVGYPEESLRLLNYVHNETGVTYYPHQLSILPWLDSVPLVNYTRVSVSGVDDQKQFVVGIAAETVGEGYVLLLKRNDGSTYAVKCKNDAYTLLHKSKDSITTPSKLFECVIDSVTDDLRSMFQNDPSAISIIDEMEKVVIPKFNHMIATVEEFHRTNKELSRKDYAILAKETMGKFMPLAMELYIGRSVKYEEFAKKNMEMFYQTKQETE